MATPSGLLGELHSIVLNIMQWLSKDNNLLPDIQFAYRSGHSTETAVLKVLADILQALDAGDFALLILLDLSAAFDSVDHRTLLERLRISYGINDVLLLWFTFYLLD